MTDFDLTIKYSDWHAIHDHMGKTLRVYGNCDVDGGGVALWLEPQANQGINDRMLTLSLRPVVTAESPGRQGLQYVQPWDDDGIQYNQVTILVPDGVTAPSPDVLSIEDIY